MDDRCICTALRQVAAQSTAYYDTMLAPSGLRVTMFRLLRRIEVVNSVTITELAEIVGLDRSTLGRNLRVLEKQSLIAIATKDDGRARRVSLTQTGREKLQQAVPLWREAQRKYLQIVNADMLALLDQVIEQTATSKYTTGDDA